jgi:hypothetical protein
MKNMEDEEEIFHTNTFDECPSPKTRPHQNRSVIEEEIRPKLLEEVRKDVGAILIKIEDISYENKKLKYIIKTLKLKSRKPKIENADGIKTLKAENQRLRAENERSQGEIVDLQKL